jgi:small multidrug resistance family-3 protein
MDTTRAICLFVLAGLAEIGGGWLVWRWLRTDAPWVAGVLGGLALLAYGVIPTWRREDSFGRVYAAP